MHNSTSSRSVVYAVSLVVMMSLVSACGGGGEAVCAAQVDFRAAQYDGRLTDEQIPRGDQLGEGTFPECKDGNTSGDSPAEIVNVHAIKNIDPQIAVSVNVNDDTIYIKHGLDTAQYPEELNRLIGKR